jgi:hypothetical protein
MKFDSAAWIKRADEFSTRGHMVGQAGASEAVQFATSMIAALYGQRSPQLDRFSAGCDAISKMKPGTGNIAMELNRHALGTIANCRAEFEAGLVSNLRVQVTGEVLSDLITLGKEVLGEGTDSAKNVAAVMIAAGFEDLTRRMATEFAGVAGRPPMQEVITTLKDAGVLKGGEVGTAQSFLKFRNDSLHADWANVSRVQVESCIAFIDAMLLKHLS